MLNVMRKHAYSWTIRIVLGVITVVFVFWGIGTGLFNQIHPIATVDGQKILPDQVDREADNLRRAFQNAYGSQAGELLKHMNVRAMALDRLIDQRLVLSQAQRLGLRISDADLRTQIASDRAFQQDGHFSLRAYQAVLRDNNYEPAAFEQMTRDDMTQQLLQEMVGQAVTLSDAQAREAYDLRHEQVKVSYIELPSANYLNKVHPTDKQIADFYARHKQRFQEPDRISVAYLHYDPAAFAAQAKPTEKQIAAFYEKNRAIMFSYPARVRARHILIAVDPHASAADRAKARAKAEKILAELKKGANFAKLAEKYSDDTATAGQGGELGFFTRGEMVKPFEDAAFALKPGQISGIVKTRFGYHIIKLQKSEPAHSDTLAQARPKIIEQLTDRAERQIANADLQDDLAAALGGTTLDKIASKRGLEVSQAGPFAAGEPIGALGYDQKFNQAAFKLAKGEVGIVRSDKGNFLVEVTDRIAAHVPPLKKIKDAVRDALVQQDAEQMALTQARALLKQVKKPSDLSKAAAQDQLKIQQTGAFDRSAKVVPSIGDFPLMTAAVGEVGKPPAMIPHAMIHDGNAYLLRVDSLTPPDQAQWGAAAKQFKAKYLQALRTQAWVSFVNSLKKKAQITIDSNQLGAGAPTQS